MIENQRFKLEKVIGKEIYEINKDDIAYYNFKGEKLLAKLICHQLNELNDEKEHYKKLYSQMSYYFREDLASLNELDHKDFQALQKLANGEYDD